VGAIEQPEQTEALLAASYVICEYVKICRYNGRGEKIDLFFTFYTVISAPSYVLCPMSYVLCHTFAFDHIGVYVLCEDVQRAEAGCVHTQVGLLCYLLHP
jgi:hypothetical protein